MNNQPGVLSRIAGVFSSRGYNIRSLCVAETINPEVSRITLTSRAESDFTEKIKKQLDKLVDVISVTDCEFPVSLRSGKKFAGGEAGGAKVPQASRL